MSQNIVNSKSTSQLILGIDPGYDRVGICVLRTENGKDELIYSECVLTDKKLQDYERVKVVCDAIEKIIEKYSQNKTPLTPLYQRGEEKESKNQKQKIGLSLTLSKREVVKTKTIDKNENKCEIVCAGVETLFVFKNQKTVMGVSEARGAIKYILHKHKIKIIELTPMQVKSSVCGDGHADKSQVDYMVRNILKIDTNKKIIDDEIDAMAIALTARLFYKNQNMV